MGLIEDSDWGSNLTGVRFSATAFGDIDNDNDNDLALIGCLPGAGANKCTKGTIAKIYINNGITFTESYTWQNNLTAVGWGALAFGDINNDGNLDLVLTGCTNASDDAANCNGDIISKIYINNGTTLTESFQWQSNLTAVYDSSIALGDINNDGRLDLVLNGKSPSLISKVYLNNGTSFVENSTWQNELTAINEGQIALGDVDNDGDLDLALTGDIGTPADFTSFYINNGTAFAESTQWNDNLVAMDRSSIVFQNYDNNNYLDMMICGHTNGDECKIYKNNGSTFNINQSETDSPAMPGLYRASFAFGDYDNDGDLDFFAMGHENGRTKTYENNETNYHHFQNDALAHANISDDFFEGALTWGDIDNDGDLDLLIAAFDAASTSVSKIYINNNTVSNTKPLSPNSSFSSTYSNNILNLSWGSGSDNETLTTGLYYNLMVGNVTNNHSIVSGVYGGSSGGGGGAGGGASGYFGNMMQRKSISLNVQLETNKTYYWYVQTIDTGLAKSNWSAVQTFNTSLDVTKPNVTINYPSPNESLHTTNPYFIFNATVTDANLTNVILYADFNGTMLANETNSSGINGTYVFTKNLTGYNDGQYSWYIYACDGTNNCETSGTRTFYLDRAYPVINLISPADAETWASSSTLTFSYNVSDVDIANCSLIVNNAVVNTSTFVSEDTEQNLTYSLSNGNYNWYVNCTDYVGYTNGSAIRSLTVSYTAPSDGGNGGNGGSGGTSITTRIYTVTNEELNKGYTQILSKNDKIKFIIANENHSLTLDNFNTNLSYANLTLNSTSINFIIYVNETRKFKLTNDNYYDLSVRLNNIADNKANLTIKQIYEKIEVLGKEEKAGEGKEEKEIEKEKISEKSSYLKYYVAAVIISVVLVYFIIRNMKIKED